MPPGQSSAQKNSVLRRGLEFFVVFIVLAILGTIVFVLTNDGRVQSRDAARAAQSQELMKVFEYHFSNTGQYPIPSEEGLVNLNDSAVASSLESSGYLRKIPEDPKYDYDDGNSYGYCSHDGSSYVLLVNAEADEDDDERCFFRRGNSLRSCTEYTEGLARCEDVF